MDEYQSLSHTTWDCKYHVVFIPKCRRKTLYLELRRYLGEVFHKLAAQKESKIEEGHLMPDHVHMMISIPPEVRGIAGDRVHQGQKRDPFGPGLRGAKAQLRGSALLGARVLRKHCGPRRGGHPRLHTQPGEGGSEAGSTQTLAITPPSGGESGAALATP